MVLFDGSYEYDLKIEDGSKYKLYHNHSEYWNDSAKGKLCFEMECDGNGYKVKTAVKNRIDYSEAVFMYIILSLEKDYKLEIVESIREL